MQIRSGILLILAGVVLAVLAAAVVIGIASQATAASHAQVRQVDVVVAKRDILDQTQVTADALEVKPFPADFAPPGAFSMPDDLVGKYAQGFLPQGQVIVAGQVKLAPLTPNVSDRIQPGMVVMWLPMPDAFSNSNVLKPGDHVDVLLTAPMGSSTTATNQNANLSTQTTLQNVEIYRIGDEELNVPSATPTDSTTSSGAGAPPQPTKPTGRQTIGLLVDHQSAVTMKFIKDSGGTVDLVTRASDDAQTVRTDGVTLDALSDQFHFRIPQSKVTGA